MQPLLATKSLTKYSLIRDVTCLFGSHLNMHQRKGQMKRKGEKRGKNFFVTVPLQKERLMFILGWVKKIIVEDMDYKVQTHEG